MRSVKKNTKDIKFILDNLRNQDRNELFSIYGDSWKNTVFRNVLNINEDYCWIEYSNDNQPILMYGIVPNENNVGVIWMLSTQDITKEQVSFLRRAKEFIAEGSEKFSLLCNFVHSDNILAIKWLKWLGFVVESPKVIGLGKKQFLFFHKECN